jgi:tetratricopeptide (TPR) repeat protein
MISLLPALLLGLGASAVASEQAVDVRRVSLHAESSKGCAGIPHPKGGRELWISGERTVDRMAHFWVLDQARSYARGRASVRYRVNSGALRVDSELAPDLGSEVVRIRVEDPIEEGYLRIYLPDVSLPCERRIRYRVRELPPGRTDLAALERFDALLHEATEVGYDSRFDESMALLRAAIELNSDDPAPYWMMARTRYLQLEDAADHLSTRERVRGYREAEKWADRAVALAPDRPEGYLWQGILRGRMATAMGNMRMAMNGMLGGRGPAWLAETLVKAVSLEEEYRFFGYSTHGNALHALAQFYRLAPDAWYMAAVGTRGDIERAVDLSREAVAAQPVRIEFRKGLAVALLCRGREEDRRAAEAELLKLLELPAITPIDRIDHTHANLLLRGAIPNVCWYSRDAVREVTAWAR